ncbi:MAG: hypothetical protein LWX52_04660 [Deltaproteobacteria bacterium]|nr:hypothetical protein [Deltaproteobacteria bacterium]
MNHLRPGNVRTPDLRDTNRLELLDGPFDTVSHTAEVRRIAGVQGKYNIPNVGIFLWRLQSYPIERVTAREIDSAQGRYTFNPLGHDIRLFNRPQTETEITHLAEEINVPGFLRRRLLYDELEARRQAIVDDTTPREAYFWASPVLEVYVPVKEQPKPIPVPVKERPKLIPVEEILISDLSDWQRPPKEKQYAPSDDPENERPMPIQVAVDPELGRLAFPAGVTHDRVWVSYSYGFSGDVGGGPYNRQESVDKALEGTLDWWQIAVSKEPVAGLAEGKVVTTICEALYLWSTQPAGTAGVITIMDNRRYEKDEKDEDFVIRMPDGSLLLIVAADWPEMDDPENPGHKIRVPGHLVPDERRAHLLGNVEVHGATSGNGVPGKLVLDGLLIDGRLTVLDGDLGQLRIAHSTLVPEMGGLEVQATHTALRIECERSICGPIVIPTNTVPELNIVDSIVSSGTENIESRPAIHTPNTATTIEMSTVFGSSEVRTLEASNSIFTDKMTVHHRQTGCVRFSYVPTDSRIPRRYRCQPDLSLKGITDEAKRAAIEARLQPVFTSVHYKGFDPAHVHLSHAYAQLSRACAEEIRTGAENGSEMGVFQHLYQPQRETNLRISLEEYLPAGLEAGIFYVT